LLLRKFIHNHEKSDLSKSKIQIIENEIFRRRYPEIDRKIISYCQKKIESYRDEIKVLERRNLMQRRSSV
jgi:hypothetical protein